MKKSILAIVAITLVIGVSCKREEQQVNPPVDISEESFLATIDNGSNTDSVPKVDDDMTTMTTITTINNTKIVNWEVGDIIYVNGKAYVTSTSGESVIFSPVNANDPATGNNFVAFYGIESPASNSATAVLPATQTYVEGKVSNLPMYATCGSERKLAFRNICAAFCITVPVNCAKIKLTASEALSGDFTMSVVDNKPAASMSSDGTTYNYIELVKSSGIFAAGDKVYLAVPQGSYTNGQIMFMDNNNVVIESKEVGAFNIVVNKIYNVSVTPYPELCFTALEGTTVALVASSTYAPAVNLQYRLYKPSADNNRLGDWTDFVGGAIGVTLAEGEKLYIRAKSSNTTFAAKPSDYHHFTSTGNVSVSGNIMCLLDSTGSATTLNSDVNSYAFYRLFSDMTKLIDASGLILPAKSLSYFCYTSMFNGCTNLTTAPALLPATTLSGYCYASMFFGCTSLTTAPELPATTLSNFCYASMFCNCSSLVNAPKLSATTLSNDCYNQMFNGCSSLVNAPALPATTLSDNCYKLMFNNCSSLAYVTMKATNVSAPCCLLDWLDGAGTSGDSHILSVDNTMVNNYTINEKKGNFTIQAYN